MKSDDLLIRPAVPEDGAAIFHIHSVSIQTLCANDYPADVVEMWASEKTTQFYSEAIEHNREEFHLAELNGVPVGFVSRKDNFLNALYLLPEAKGKGVGKKLLQLFEELVSADGFDEILLSSTITALPFYQHAGFQLVEELKHTLNCGLDITCFRMKKPVQAEKLS